MKEKKTSNVKNTLKVNREFCSEVTFEKRLSNVISWHIMQKNTSGTIK